MTQRPIVRLLAILGQRWTLRVLWELREERTHRFRPLQSACGDLSPSVLNKRLASLREIGVVEHTGEGYRLTKEGRELGETLQELDRWARRYL